MLLAHLASMRTSSILLVFHKVNNTDLLLPFREPLMKYILKTQKHAILPWKELLQ